MARRPLNSMPLRPWTLLVLSLLTSAPSGAETSGSSLSVTATVATNCIISTSAVAFGSYDPVQANQSTDLTGVGSITLTCTTGSAATITLGQGAYANPASTDAIPKRRLNSAANNKLPYYLYRNSSHTTVWGNTTGTGVLITGTGLGSSLTVYGKIQAGQNVPVGSYSDTVVATIQF